MERQDFTTGQREEKKFFELFYRALILMMEETTTTDEDIESGIEKVINGFKGGPRGVCDAGNFQTPGDELGYFYWSSPLAASVTRVKTLAAFNKCTEFWSRFRQTSLKIVSLGAGTGSDLVGLFSAIREWSILSGEPVFDLMDILLMDNNSVWEKFFDKIEKILRDPDLNFGNASKLMSKTDITTFFLQADLKYLSTEIFEISNADIVWMKGIQSIQKNDRHRELIVDNIVSSMTKGSLLAVLDSPFYETFVTTRTDLQKIYSTDASDKFILQPISDLQEIHRFKYCRCTNQELIILKKR